MIRTDVRDKTQEIIEEFKINRSVRQLYKKYNCGNSVIRNILKKSGIYNEYVQKKYGNHENSDYEILLDLENKQSLYWLGFMAGDFCIGDNGSITCELGITDYMHLVKFKEFVNTENPIRVRTQVRKTGNSSDLCSLCICSMRLKNGLQELGITPRKSLTLNIENKILINSKDFWRGLIDANGSLCTYQDTKGYLVYEISLSGTYNILNKFSEYIEKNIMPVTRKIRNVVKICHIKFSGRSAYKLIRRQS